MEMKTRNVVTYSCRIIFCYKLLSLAVPFLSNVITTVALKSIHIISANHVRVLALPNQNSSYHPIKFGVSINSLLVLHSPVNTLYY